MTSLSTQEHWGSKEKEASRKVSKKSSGTFGATFGSS